MVQYRASWVVPISRPPIRDGWVAVDRGRVVALGGRAPSPAFARDLGDVVLMPGLTNAHTHLELSYLRDAVPPGGDFVDWIRRLVRLRRQAEEAEATDVLAALETAIAEAVASGTVLVGDISNTLCTVAPLARSALAATVFYELIRFSTAGADEYVQHAWQRIDGLAAADSVRVTLAAHAPYSVAPTVFRAMRDLVHQRSPLPCSVHLSESVEETEFISRGTGAWRGFLEEVGAWDRSWVAPGVSPVDYLDQHGFLDARVIAVHGVQMSAEDLARLARRGVTLVTCPRSNRYTGAGVPPLEQFFASGVRVAVGTDSLASTPDLNVFAELAAMRALAPAVPAAALLESATRHGAEALGFGSEFGSIEPGKRARLLAVDIPPRTDDVEEYLVSGIRPEQVKWVDE